MVRNSCNALILYDLPHVNQRCLLVPEIHLQPKTIFVFNNSSDYDLCDSASVQVYADVLADLKFALRLVRFAGHAEILWFWRVDIVVKSEAQHDERLRKLLR